MRLIPVCAAADHCARYSLLFYPEQTPSSARPFVYWYPEIFLAIVDMMFASPNFEQTECSSTAKNSFTDTDRTRRSPCPVCALYIRRERMCKPSNENQNFSSMFFRCSSTPSLITAQGTISSSGMIVCPVESTSSI